MKKLFLFCALSFISQNIYAKLVKYELVATQGKVNLSGKKEVDFALMINNQIPAPTLEFTEGDEAEIVVKNQIPDQEVSIHWHGILLPPEMDGVAYVTTPPIPSGTEHTFRFKIRQHGTFWYHSHTNIQEQKGIFGAFIIHPKKETLKYDKEIVAILNDWTDEDPTSVIKNLKKDGDYYLYKKNTIRSWFGAIQAGKFGNFLNNERTRMGGMDLSDVGYDAFLINGKKDSQLLKAKKGEKIRIRIINAAASTYFYVSLGNLPMNVVAVDGQNIMPAQAREILTGMAETHDVLFEVPESKNYELKITAQDGTGTASGWIGMNEKVFAPIKPTPDLYATMDHSAHAGHSGHGAHTGHEGHKGSSMDHSAVIETLTVDNIMAEQSTEFSPKAKRHDIKLVLGGDMSRYTWFINNKAIHEDRTIYIDEGEVVRFTINNDTMMHHPMHLHGHFFRVINQYGEYSPLKHTVDVPPHGTRTIEFLANEPGEWMLHCHNLYHMKSGMARVVKYMSYTPRPEIAAHQKHDPHLHDHIYYYGRTQIATNQGEAYLRASQTWNQIEARLEGKNLSKSFSFDKKWETEGDLFYRRWTSQYLNFSGGLEYFDEKYSAIAGLNYLLPFLVESGIYVNHRGNFRLELEKKFQWTKYVFSNAELRWRPDKDKQIKDELEYTASLMFSNSWNWAVGFLLNEESIGAGLEAQF